MKEHNYDVWEVKMLGIPFRWATPTSKSYKAPQQARLLSNVWTTNKRKAVKKAVWLDKM